MATIWVWYANLPIWAAFPLALAPGILVTLSCYVYNRRIAEKTIPAQTGKRQRKSVAKPKSRTKAKKVSGEPDHPEKKEGMETEDFPIWRCALNWTILAVIIVVGIVLLIPADAKFQQEYPFGYIVYGPEGTRLGPKKLHPSISDLNADWIAMKIEVNQQQKTAMVSIPRLNLVGGPSAGSLDDCYFSSQPVPYRLGSPVEIKAVAGRGVPKMYLEVLDDTGTVPKCILGFR